MNGLLRVVPNIQTTNMQQSAAFYSQILGCVKVMDLGWIQTFAAPQNSAIQISLITTDPAGFHPHLSIEVADVDAVYAAAIADNASIVYPLSDEPWGVRRFFVRDPNGTIVNVVSHCPVREHII